MSTKKSRGRPANVGSFVKVKIKDLLKVFNEDASVVLSKRWLDQLGVKLHSIDHKPQ
jgi:hypothetical protein